MITNQLALSENTEAAHAFKGEVGRVRFEPVNDIEIIPTCDRWQPLASSLYFHAADTKTQDLITVEENSMSEPLPIEEASAGMTIGYPLEGQPSSQTDNRCSDTATDGYAIEDTSWCTARAC